MVGEVRAKERENKLIHRKHDGDCRFRTVIYRGYQENHDEILYACTTRDWREKRAVEVVVQKGKMQ